MLPPWSYSTQRDLEPLFALKLLSGALLCILFTSTATDSLNVYGQTRRGCRLGRESRHKRIQTMAGERKKASQVVEALRKRNSSDNLPPSSVSKKKTKPKSTATVVYYKADSVSWKVPFFLAWIIHLACKKSVGDMLALKTKLNIFFLCTAFRIRARHARIVQLLNDAGAPSVSFGVRRRKNEGDNLETMWIWSEKCRLLVLFLRTYCQKWAFVTKKGAGSVISPNRKGGH